MLIKEEELQRLYKKYPYPRFSKEEYDRRYRNVRNLLKEKELDCLLVIGGSAAYGRLWFNIRYLTNWMGKAEMAWYCFFPKDGEPCLAGRPSHSLADGMFARSVVKEVMVGRPDGLPAIKTRIKEKGYDKGRIGIVGYDVVTSIPKEHWDFFTSELPEAEFVFVTKEFLALRLVKSKEEIEALEKSAELEDIGIQALADKLKPGMTEAEAFAIVYEAVVRNGGEMGMIQLSSTPMLDPDIGDQRPRPVDRVIGNRDIINNELGVFYNGYEAQTGKPIVTGAPTEEFKDMFEVAMEGYKQVAASLYPGKTSTDSVKAATCVQKRGYDCYGGFLQGMLGADPRHEPQIGFGNIRPEDKLFPGDELVYQEGMAFVLQIHVITKEKAKGLFLGDTFAVTASGPRCLNKLPPQLIRI